MSKDEESGKLIKAFLTDDELALVVRSHIKVEEQLDKLLILFIAEQKYLDKIKLEFSEKVLLAAALGMDEDLIQPLSVLGRIRNKFAHKTDSELTKSDVNNLYKSFSALGKEVLQQTTKNNPDRPPQLSTKYNDMTIREKFVLMTIYLHSWIRGLVHEEVGRMQEVTEKAANTKPEAS
tara:strand:+ start:2313 stop:2846 length:534 start_codon:yes stop_codon:yes gene_type:complete